MPARGWMEPPLPTAGYQRHHLLPIALLRRPQMASLFDQLEAEGFVLHSFPQNGLLLPATEAEALLSGHALHRGPHPDYSDVVAARVERTRACFVRQAPHDLPRARRQAIARLRLLQQTARRALTDRHGCGFWLNRRDPMRLFADRPYLDETIARLYGAISR